MFIRAPAGCLGERKAFPKSFLDWIRSDLECVNLKGVCASTGSIGGVEDSTSPFVFNCLAQASTLSYLCATQPWQGNGCRYNTGESW